jgi:uncharacterized protein YkwD
MRRHKLPISRFLLMITSLFALAAVLPLAGALSTPAEASAACTSTRSTNDTDEATMVGLINSYRTSKGLPALTATAGLTRAAISKSQDMASTGVFAHDSISDTMARFSACGNSSSSIAENIAAGNSDPNGTFQQWVNSPEHNANMLGAYTAIGIGRAYGTYSSGGQTYTNFAYWTAEFGNVVDTPTSGTTGNVTPSGSGGTGSGVGTFPGISTPAGSGVGTFPGTGTPPPPPGSGTSANGVGYFPGIFTPSGSGGTGSGVGTFPGTTTPAGPGVGYFPGYPLLSGSGGAVFPGTPPLPPGDGSLGNGVGTFPGIFTPSGGGSLGSGVGYFPGSGAPPSPPQSGDGVGVFPNS